MPALHFDRRRLRRTVCVTLAAWLFALTAGVVNACVLTPHSDALRAAVLETHRESPARQEPAGSPAQAGDDQHRSHDDRSARAGHAQDGGDAGQGSCVKFCDDESSALAKYNAPILDLGAGVATVFEPWSAAVSITGAESRRSLERLPAHGPPLAIRFLRLTL